MDLDSLLQQANENLDDANNMKGGLPELSLPEAETETTTLDDVMKLIEDDDNEFLIYSSLNGKNPITGDQATMAESMSTIYSELMTSETTYSEPSEGFSESEIEVLRQIIAQTNLGEAEKQIYKKLAPITEEIITMERWYSNTAIKKRNNEVKMLKNYEFIEKYQDRIHYIIMYHEGKVGNFERTLTEDEKLRPHHYITEYDLAISGNRNLAKEIETLDKTLANQEKMIRELNEKNTKEYTRLYKEIEHKVFDQLNEPEKTISKIVAIEFGQTLKDKNSNIEVYSKCQCGTASAFPLKTMMHFVLGDVFHDYHQRIYENKEVKANLFSRVTGGPNREEGTKYRLIKEEGNEKYRRVIIPGISNNEEGMVCPSCSRLMVPPIEVIDKMINYGHIINEYSLEASKHKIWGNDPIKPGESSHVYGGAVWNTIYDDYLYKPNEIKGENISADFRKRDESYNSNSQIITSLPDSSKRLYARYLGNFKGEVDVKNLKNEIEGYRRSVQIVADKIVKANRIVSTDNMDDSKRLRAMERNKLKKSLIKILKADDLIEMCISKRISPLELEELAKLDPNNIKHLRNLLTEYTRNNLINTAIEPILEFKDGKWYVGTQDINTPHFKFVLMYKDSLTEFTKKIDRTKYGILMKMNEIIKTYTMKGSDKELESEKVIKELRTAMGQYHMEHRDEQLMKFVDNFGFGALTNEDGYAPCWLVNDLLRIGIDNIEPKSFTVYNSLYPSGETV